MIEDGEVIRTEESSIYLDEAENNTIVQTRIQENILENLQITIIIMIVVIVFLNLLSF